jgi:alkylation response protein AidB-like acyl-CoA dehydrogenase
MISLEMFSSYCLTEPGSGSDAQAMKVKKKNYNFIKI